MKTGGESENKNLVIGRWPEAMKGIKRSMLRLSRACGLIRPAPRPHTSSPEPRNIYPKHEGRNMVWQQQIPNAAELAVVRFF